MKSLLLILFIIKVTSSLSRGSSPSSIEISTRWTSAAKFIIDGLEDYIHYEEYKLLKLRSLHDILNNTLRIDTHKITASDLSETTTDEILGHPVGKFITLNRIIKVIDEVQLFMDEGDEIMQEGVQGRSSFKMIFEKMKSTYNIPTHEDLIASGEALLRLQVFYQLDIDDIVTGKLLNVTTDDYPLHTFFLRIGYHMKPWDCFQLGKIAYDGGDYSLSIQWFQKSLVLLEDEQHSSDEISSAMDFDKMDYSQVNEVLEYMAFAAFRNGQIRYSAKLTRIWLKRDPENDRASGNLEYYLEELAKSELNDTINIPNKSDPKFEKSLVATQSIASYNDYSLVDRLTSDYILVEDEILRSLCRGASRPTRNTCRDEYKFLKNLSNPELKIETLYSNPDIIRIYDILTEEEAQHLRLTAYPNLRRSTVQTKSGLVTSDFRIAQTAWLSRISDPIVELIENRLSEILDLNMDGSEDFQVVNYGIGGFYGPHLDAARDSKVFAIDSDDSWQFNQLAANDRLATILVYLNRVEAGGSTVFPKLGLSVEPVERSAVVWYNIHKNGLADERTLHTGCPVLLGSKWIATKWPREQANTFLRPCGLRPDD